MALDPNPAIVRPRMKTDDVGATVQIRDPISKMTIPKIKTDLRGKTVKTLPKLLQSASIISLALVSRHLQEYKRTHGHAAVQH